MGAWHGGMSENINTFKNISHLLQKHTHTHTNQHKKKRFIFIFLITTQEKAQKKKKNEVRCVWKKALRKVKNTQAIEERNLCGKNKYTHNYNSSSHTHTHRL